MKLIYLHDPKVGTSVLTQLEETFPMLEIVAIDLDDDFDKQFEELKKLFGQFTFTTITDYAIIADGFGIAYASFFTGICVKGQTLPKVTILINPDYRAVRNNPAFNKIPKEDYLGEERDCLYFLHSLSIFSCEKYNLLAYHQQHYGGNYLLVSQVDIFTSILNLITKSALGSVTINYLKAPILTPKGQIIPPDYPLISVEGSFNWFGEKLFNARIPNSAFHFRDSSCFLPPCRYLLPGDVIEPYPHTQKYFKFLTCGDFKDLTTGKIIKGHRILNNPIGPSLPDWSIQWLFKELIQYKTCVPFKSLKNGARGFDKYGHEFIIKAIDIEAQFLWEDNLDKGAIQQRDQRCEDYIAGVFPKSETPDKIFLLSYNYEGIMVFRSSGKKTLGYPISKILERKIMEQESDKCNKTETE